MSELADKFERYFEKQDLVPLKINGAKWNDPERSIRIHISQLRHSRKGSDMWNASLHHLKRYKEALSHYFSTGEISIHQKEEKVPQIQNKAHELEGLLGTEIP